MVLDYRALNKITLKRRFPMPNIVDLFDQLEGVGHILRPPAFMAMACSAQGSQVCVADPSMLNLCVPGQVQRLLPAVWKIGLSDAR